MDPYSNIKSGAGAISGNAINLPSFIPTGTGLNTSALTLLLPQNQQSSWQNGILNKNSNINQNYSDFNSSHPSFTLNRFASLATTGSINKYDPNQIETKYKPEIIEENITEYLPNQRGYYNNLKQTPLQKPKSISPNGSPSGIVSDAVKTPQQQLTERMYSENPAERSNFQQTATTGQKATAFMSGAGGAAVNAAAGLVGSALNTVGSMVGPYADRPEAQQLDETQEAVRSGIYSAVSAVPVWGPLISAGLQMTDGLGKLIGGQMSNISKDAAEDAGLNRGLNNVVATIPGVGSMLGLFTKKTDEFKFDRSRVDNISSAYDMSTFDSADDLSGGKFLGQRDKVNNFIAEQNRKKDLMTGISDTQKLRKMGASAMAADLAQQNKNRYGGVTGQQFAIGKEGMKFPNLNWARETLLKFKDGGKIQQDIPEFQKGGKLGTPGIESNVIVEGAYHAHKNHLDEINPELQDVTPKGIPVLAHDETGDTQQIAEIERKELILTKELTDKIEALYKDGSDEAAIEAGMLFADELFNNTEDNTGEVLNENN